MPDYPPNCPKCDLPGKADRDCFDYECGSGNNAPGIFGVPEGFCQSRACAHIVSLKKLSVEGDYPLNETSSLVYLGPEQLAYLKRLLDADDKHLFRYPYGPQKFADLVEKDDGTKWVDRYSHHLYMLGVGRL